jgi:hypothetical protein
MGFGPHVFAKDRRQIESEKGKEKQRHSEREVVCDGGQLVRSKFTCL